MASAEPRRCDFPKSDMDCSTFFGKIVVSFCLGVLQMQRWFLQIIFENYTFEQLNTATHPNAQTHIHT